MILLKRIIGGNEQGKALGKTAALFQLVDIDMSVQALQIRLFAFRKENGVTVKIDNTFHLFAAADEIRISFSDGCLIFPRSF